jgi:mannose-6-phosphate isomerase-like protein (cupin superfamily)
LYFPPGIDQTAHTHPSDRIGIVMSGRGRCVYWENGVELTQELEPGMLWVIHTDGVHKFQTPHGEHLRVLAYHPDSDYGPTHQFHPMLNRTIVDGVSANQLPAIQTK